MRVAWLEHALAGAALVVALAALVFSFVESRRSEDFARLQSMPLLTVGDALSNDTFSITASNETNNPAIIKWYALVGRTSDAKAYTYDTLLGNYDELYEWLSIPEEPRTWSFRMLWPESALSPGTALHLISEPDNSTARELWRLRDEFNAQVCYCSVLGDCKVAQLRATNPPLTPVDQCVSTQVFDSKVRLPPSFTNIPKPSSESQ